MIPIEKEPDEMFRWTKVYEDCFFCKQPTDMWNRRTNQPVCEYCAVTHSQRELPKSHPDYQPTKERK